MFGGQRDYLEHTLRLRLSRGPLDEAQVQHVVSKLDEASAAIEQS
jgi:hypothetical protein